MRSLALQHHPGQSSHTHTHSLAYTHTCNTHKCAHTSVRVHTKTYLVVLYRHSDAKTHAIWPSRASRAHCAPTCPPVVATMCKSNILCTHRNTHAHAHAHTHNLWSRVPCGSCCAQCTYLHTHVCSALTRPLSAHISAQCAHQHAKCYTLNLHCGSCYA